jgi:hypothetical protein
MNRPVLIPPPLPNFTLCPSMPDLNDEEMASVERCLAGLAGKVPGVLVTSVRSRGRHRVIELQTALGPVIVSEPTEVPLTLRTAG